MADQCDVTQLLAKIKAGDQDAEQQLFHQYVPRMTLLARRRLAPHFKNEADDVVQLSVMKLFQLIRDGSVKAQTEDSLWSLAAIVTIRKCYQQVRYARAAKRKGEVSQTGTVPEGESAWQQEPVAFGGTSSNEMKMTEALQKLLYSLDEKRLEILFLKMQGYTVEQIAQVVQRSDRMVRRVCQEIHEQVELQRQALP